MKTATHCHKCLKLLEALQEHYYYDTKPSINEIECTCASHFEKELGEIKNLSEELRHSSAEIAVATVARTVWFVMEVLVKSNVDIPAKQLQTFMELQENLVTMAETLEAGK